MTGYPSYQPVVGWPLIPHGMTFRGSATSVAVAANDRVLVFNRGNKPLAVFDRNGNLEFTWTDEEQFVRPHSITVDAFGDIYVVDDGAHFVQKRSIDGEILFTLGNPRNPAPWQSGDMFNRPTDVAVHPVTRDLFVSDGYGNSRVHRFSPEGDHILSWGESGADPGQFSLPHNIAVTKDDRVLVCDRENFRIQIFTVDGRFLDQWHMYRPVCIEAIDDTDGTVFVVGEHSPPRIQKGVSRLGCCVKILDERGNELTRIGGELPGHEPHLFMDPHSIAVDSEQSIYVAEVCNSWVAGLNGPPPLGEWPSLRKWRRTDATSVSPHGPVVGRDR